MTNEKPRCYQCKPHLEDCNGERDTYECGVCHRTWTEKCNFDEDFS